MGDISKIDPEMVQLQIAGDSYRVAVIVSVVES